MLCLLDGFEAASLTEFTTKNHRKVLAGRHKFWATNQGAEEAVEFFDAHRFAGITEMEEVFEAVEFSIGQALCDGVHPAILTAEALEKSMPTEWAWAG